MSNTAYGSTFVNGITVSSTGSPEPARTPKGVIVTRAIELKAGWVGQVIVAEEVVKEKDGFEKASEAEEWATGQVIAALRKLLGA